MDRYALIIGISQYDRLEPLSKPSGDAIALKQTLEAHDWRVRCLHDRVDYSTLEAALTEFLERQAVGQDALIYFTGHGFMVEESEDDRRGYLATTDCAIEQEGKTIVSQRRGLSFKRLNGLIQRARISSLVVLLDCCHGGLFVEDGLVKGSLKAEADQNFCWIAACRSFQQSYARKVEAHSLFTGALLEALAESQADSGEVTVLSVLRYVNAAFKQLQMQEPIYIGAGKDIPLIRYGQRSISTAIREENPYQGLLAFTPETKQFFFGRDRVVDGLLLKLQAANFVPVIGPSGSGKSSVVRAGLVPRLRDLGWRVLEPMKPGVKPIYELQRSFDGVFDRRKLAEIYACIEAEGLRGIVDRLPEQKHLLVIDQFEEVFTLSPDRAKQRRFIELLMGLESGDRLAIVTTMRSDFVEDWQAHGDLVAMLQAQTVWMPPLEGEELRSAIVCPAQVQGYSFEVGLERLILDDVAAEVNALPLLEFALEKLWEQRDREKHRLTIAAYEGMGRLMGALDLYATDWYEKLSAEQQELVRRVMLELVRVGMETRDTRQRRKRSEVLALGDGEVQEVVDLLVDRRLLVSEGEEIDLAHERLMDGWQLFAAWRQVDRDLRRLAQRVKDTEQEWREKGQQNDYLLQGGLLSEVREQWHDLAHKLSSTIHDFYQKSQEYHQFKRLRFDYPIVERELYKQALQTRRIISKQPERAALETIRSIGISLFNLEGNVIHSIQENLCKLAHQFYEPYYISPLSGIESFALSPNGQTIAIANKNMIIQILDMKGNLIGETPPLSSHIYDGCLAFTSDSQMIISTSQSKIEQWNLAGDPVGKSFEASDYHNESIHKITCSPDGETIASIGETGTFCLWDFNGKLLFQSLKEYEAWSIAFSPDGRKFATSSFGKIPKIKLWEINGRPIGKPFWEPDSVFYALSFSPDGQTIAAGSSGIGITLWDLDGNKLGQSYIGEYETSENIESVAFSPDGSIIVSASSNYINAPSTICLWNLEAKPLSVPSLKVDRLKFPVVFTPDGTFILGSTHEKIMFWLGGTWQDWLRICCNHLRHHPSLNDPHNPAAVEACEVCRKYVWDKEG